MPLRRAWVSPWGPRSLDLDLELEQALAHGHLLAKVCILNAVIDVAALLARHAQARLDLADDAERRGHAKIRPWRASSLNRAGKSLGKRIGIGRHIDQAAFDELGLIKLQATGPGAIRLQQLLDGIPVGDETY